MKDERTLNRAEIAEEELIRRFRACLRHGFGELHVFFRIPEKGKRAVTIQGGKSNIHTMDECELRQVR